MSPDPRPQPVPGPGGAAPNSSTSSNPASAGASANPGATANAGANPSGRTDPGPSPGSRPGASAAPATPPGARAARRPPDGPTAPLASRLARRPRGVADAEPYPGEDAGDGGEAERHVPHQRVTPGRALAGVAGISAIGTLLSRMTGLARTIVQGSALGINGVSDAYNLANTTPNIVYDLVLGGILAGTLVPVFVSALAEDPERGWEAISAVCSAIAAVLVGVTVVFLAAAPLIIRFYTLTTHGAASGPERALATSLLYLFVPQLMLYGLTAMVTAVLAARRSYAVPMYTPVLNNVIVIGVLVAFAATISRITPAAVRADRHAVVLLGLGTTAGVAAMAVALLPALRRAGVHLRWRWDPGHPACRRILRLSGWTAGFVVANQVALLVVILVAGHAPGDYSAYFYAYQFFLLPHGIWVVSLLGPMETEMAHCWRSADRAGARRHLVEAIWLGAVLIVPAGLGYAVLARPVIDLVLLHGHVSAAGARATADTLAAFALGLPTFSLYAVLMRAYQAMQDTRSMFFVYVAENVANVVLAVVLYPRFGVAGLGAAWSLAYAGGAIVALAHLSRRFGGAAGHRLAGAQLGRAVGTVLLGAAGAAGAAAVVSFAGAHVLGGARGVGLAVRVTVAVGAGVSVYVVAAQALGFGDIRRRLGLRRRPA